VDEVVRMKDLRKYMQAFVGSVYQNPKSICPQHHMILPRIIKDQETLRLKAAAEAEGAAS